MVRRKLSDLVSPLVGAPVLRWNGPPPDVSAWYGNKDFTSDWLSRDLGPWLAALTPLRDMPLRVLDIGSYEGRSAITFLELLPRSHVTSMDHFVYPGSDKGPAVEARFDANIRSYGERIRKMKGPAAGTLDSLRVQGEVFDIVYADAGKERDWVFAKSALAWPLLKVGGIFIWDDLKWGLDRPSAERPGDAILLFAKAFAQSLQVLHKRRQLLARKTSEWPNMS